MYCPSVFLIEHKNKENNDEEISNGLVILWICRNYLIFFRYLAALFAILGVEVGHNRKY